MLFFNSTTIMKKITTQFDKQQKALACVFCMITIFLFELWNEQEKEKKQLLQQQKKKLIEADM